MACGRYAYVALVALLALAGCERAAGRAIAVWTLDADPGPHGVAVKLPLDLVRALPASATPFSLRTTVALAPDERGHELTLVFGCYHAALQLVVNGTPLDDDGETGLGEHRFVISAALTRGGTLDIAASSRLDSKTVLAGFGAAPELEVGANRQPWPVIIFIRDTAMLALVFGCVLTLMFGAMFALDRRRRENAALAVMSIAIVPYALAWVGLLSIADPGVRVLLSVQLGITQVAVLFYFHLVFELGRVPRAWFVAIGALTAAELLSFAWYPAKTALATMKPLEQVAFGAYLLARLVPRAWKGTHRGDARLLVAGGSLAMVFVVLEGVQNHTGRWYGGLHTIQLAVIVIYAALALVLVRQHVARERALERTTHELGHQIAARSSELATALLRLEARAPVVLGRVVDGRYRIVRELGAGGMGAVYEAERLADGTRVALKTLRGAVDPAAMARFAREAQIAASLDHPNLVPVLDVGLDDGLMFLVMPLMPGGSLERRGGDLDITLRLRDIAAGLAALHERGIVHRDLKPANVLLEHGTARISDFGLASLGAGRDDAALTRAGAMFGTPHYMAPELVAGTREATPASDVFGFGVLAYELVAGAPAFAEPPLLARIGGRPTDAPTFDGVPERLRPLLARCLSFDPSERPSASELVAWLDGPRTVPGR